MFDVVRGSWFLFMGLEWGIGGVEVVGRVRLVF